MSGEEDKEEDVEDLLKRLLELSSEEASLHFKLASELEEARVETVRFLGLFSMCELSDPDMKIYRPIVEDLINKYVVEIRRSSSRESSDEKDRC